MPIPVEVAPGDPEGCRLPSSGEAHCRGSEERRGLYPVEPGRPSSEEVGWPCPGWYRERSSEEPHNSDARDQAHDVNKNAGCPVPGGRESLPIRAG